MRARLSETERAPLHLMCLGLTDPLDAGSTVPVSIEFSEREPVEIAVAVELR